MPFAAAQFCRFVFPKAAQWVGNHSQISFYMWLASLLVIIGRTTAFIIDLHDASLSTELWLAFAALVICLVQFKVGRMLGRRYGDPPRADSRSGRKNTVLAGVDGAVVPESHFVDRPHGVYRLAELREQLSNLQKG